MTTEITTSGIDNDIRKILLEKEIAESDRRFVKMFQSRIGAESVHDIIYDMNRIKKAIPVIGEIIKTVQ